MTIEINVRRWVQENASASTRNREIANDTLLVDEGVLDSLGIMNLVNWIEQEYEFDIAEDDFDISNFESISRIVAYVRANSELQLKD